MSSQTRTETVSAFDALSRALRRKPAWRPFAPHVESTRDKATDCQRDVASRLVGWARTYLGQAYDDVLAEGYVRFVTDVNMQQLRYERRGHYESRSFSEVFEKAYGNPSFMNDYHWGVFSSTFAWEHHLRLAEFFLSNFCGTLTSSAEPTRLLDLGCGSGLWSLLALSESPTSRSLGVDISQTSVDNANAMATAIGFGDRFQAIVSDATTWHPEENSEDLFDAGVSAFVLEHLERPKNLLQALARNIRPHGVAFVTAALTAAEIDHIYEFQRESELLRLAEEAGFRVVQSMSLMPGSYRADGRFPPRSMAMILSRRAGELW